MLLRNTGIFTRILAFLHVDQSGPAAGWTQIWRSDLKAEWPVCYLKEPTVLHMCLQGESTDTFHKVFFL